MDGSGPDAKSDGGGADLDQIVLGQSDASALDPAITVVEDGDGRGPDFTVTYRGERTFNLEVTRLRRAPGGTGDSGRLLAKLRQLPPSAPNALLVAIEGKTAEALDVPAVIRVLRARADGKDEAFFSSRGFDGTRGVYERYLRLGAVVVWCELAAGDARASLWSNRSARIAVPERAARACVLCLRAG